MIAYCGLDCSECNAYLATMEDSDIKKRETAEKLSQIYRHDIRPEQINCSGCKSSGAKFFHCGRCGIRQCCILKGVENCASCESYKCDTLAGYIKLVPDIGVALETFR